MKKALIISVLLVLVFSGCIQNDIDEDDFTIACWNLQGFGPTKSDDAGLIQYYADKLDDHDIFIVQEIRDISGEAIDVLATALPQYKYIISERAGQSSYKEQYAVFYNPSIQLIESFDYTSSYQSSMQRPPLRVTFKADDWTFTIYTMHTQPTNVYGELTRLETIVGNPVGDAIIIGDLNADGSYYNEDSKQHFTSWQWVITDDVDTTVAASDNTYDRIIINNHCQNNIRGKGVMNDVNPSQSDHYLVYAIFDTSQV